MLSTADKLTNNFIAKDSTWQNCVFDQAFHISTSQGTHSNEWMHIHAIHKHTFAHVCERILTSDVLQRTLWSSLYRTSYLCWVFPSNLHVGFHPNITLCVFLISRVCVQCVLMLSVSSEKTPYECNLHTFPNRKLASVLGNCACLFKVSQSSIISSV